MNCWASPLLPEGETESAVGAVSTQAWNVVGAVPAVARKPGPSSMQLPATNVTLALPLMLMTPDGPNDVRLRATCPAP